MSKTGRGWPGLVGELGVLCLCPLRLLLLLISMGIFRNSDVALELFLVKEDDCACADLIDEVFDEVDLVSNDEDLLLIVVDCLFVCSTGVRGRLVDALDLVVPPLVLVCNVFEEPPLVLITIF